MNINITVECPIHDSFRVRQVAGMFDVPLSEKCERQFSVELPDLDEPWQIGVIVGPSGSGKTTVARAAFADAFFRGGNWAMDRAVIDGFGDRPIKQITQALTAVGFSSPPAWIKPYHVLSNGEKFRCDLAQALLSDQPLVVFDEFTSVVDRTVAKIGSAAVARAIRKAKSKKSRAEGQNRNALDSRLSALRFIAVTCHYDVLRWLQPDWVLDMAAGTFDRRRLRRPRIKLKIFRCRYEAWRLFAPHHYLSGSLNKIARCYLAAWRGEPVAFCALLSHAGRRGIWRISRIVVLPDYQGLGVGGRLCAALGEMYQRQGQRLTITTGHPAMIAHLRDSPRWRVGHIAHGGYRWGRFARHKNIRSTSRGRTVVSAEYWGALSTQRTGQRRVSAR